MDIMVSFLYGWIEWFKRRFQHIPQPIVFCFSHLMLLSFRFAKILSELPSSFLFHLFQALQSKWFDYITRMINACLCVTCGIELIKTRQHKIATILHPFLSITHFPPSIANVKVKSQTYCSILDFNLYFLCLRCDESI